MKGWGVSKIGVVFMLLISAVAATGMGYGLWAQSLTITETVSTGNVTLEYTLAFTDDDGKVDDVAYDSEDDDGVTHPPLFDVHGTSSSPDPSATGEDPKPHYDKDIARCAAAVGAQPDTATVFKDNVYPSYHCTAWFDVLNSGTIPVKVKSITLTVSTTSTTSTKVDPLSVSSTPLDLDNADGDDILATGADVEVTVTHIELCQQIEPQETVRMDIDQHILQEAPQTQTLSYTVKVEMAQWNELGDIVDTLTTECQFIGGP